MYSVLVGITCLFIYRGSAREKTNKQTKQEVQSEFWWVGDVPMYHSVPLQESSARPKHVGSTWTLELTKRSGFGDA